MNTYLVAGKRFTDHRLARTEQRRVASKRWDIRWAHGWSLRPVAELEPPMTVITTYGSRWLRRRYGRYKVRGGPQPVMFHQ